MQAAAIIVAAGQGTRMGPDTDKLFLPVHGRPVIGHTWSRFDRAGLFREVVLVIRPGREQDFQAVAKDLDLCLPYRLIPGGAERQDSVWNGLEAMPSDIQCVAVQDGARPCTARDLIQATLQAAHESGAAVAAQAMTDTIKESVDGRFISRHLDRSVLWSVQTPQCFRLSVIRQALQAVRQQGRRITDDTAACELIGQAVRLVSTPHPNPKLTSPSDVAALEALLASEQPG